MVDFNQEFQSQAELVPQPKFEPTSMGQTVDVPDFQFDYSALGPIMQPNPKIDLSQFQAELPQNKVKLPGKEAVQSPNSADYQLDGDSYVPSAQINSSSILSGAKGVTQQFGNPNAALYGYAANGKANINRGTDIAIPLGSPQAAPPEGNWVVEKVATDGKFNTGWGNYVKMRNTDTGETIQLSHLDKVFVQPGQKVSGVVVGTTGRTGRTTGSHADIEYTKDGQLQNILTSPYRKYLGLTQQTSSGAKGGGVVDSIKSGWNQARRMAKNAISGDVQAKEALMPSELYSPTAIAGVITPTKIPKSILKNLTMEDRNIAGKFVQLAETKSPRADFGKAGKDAQYLIQGLRDAGLKIDPGMTTKTAAKFFNNLIEQADRLAKIKK